MTLRLEQNGNYFIDNILKWIFLNESHSKCISTQISLKFVPQGPIHNNLAWG